MHYASTSLLASCLSSIANLQTLPAPPQHPAGPSAGGCKCVCVFLTRLTTEDRICEGIGLMLMKVRAITAKSFEHCATAKLCEFI